MLEKDQLGGGKVRVTFLMPAMEGVGTLSVCGEFNDWNPAVTPMTRAADGTWSAALTLEAGRSYQFRYRDDRGGWHNDPAADTYVPNDFGSKNSVVDLLSKPESTGVVGAGPETGQRMSGTTPEAGHGASPAPSATAKPAAKKPAARKAAKTPVARKPAEKKPVAKKPKAR